MERSTGQQMEQHGSMWNAFVWLLTLFVSLPMKLYRYVLGLATEPKKKPFIPAEVPTEIPWKINKDAQQHFTENVAELQHQLHQDKPAYADIVKEGLPVAPQMSKKDDFTVIGGAESLTHRNVPHGIGAQ